MDIVSRMNQDALRLVARMTDIVVNENAKQTNKSRKKDFKGHTNKKENEKEG